MLGKQPTCYSELFLPLFERVSGKKGLAGGLGICGVGSKMSFPCITKLVFYMAEAIAFGQTNSNACIDLFRAYSCPENLF